MKTDLEVQELLATVAAAKKGKSNLQKEKSMRQTAVRVMVKLQKKVKNLEKALSREKQKREKDQVSLIMCKDKLADTKKQFSDEHKKLQIAQKLLSKGEQKSVSVSGTYGGIWQYEDADAWYDFPPESSNLMTRSYLVYLRDRKTGNRIASINSAGVDRLVDFETMRQKRADTKKARKIRFWPAVPVEWSTTPAELLLQSDNAASFYVEVTDVQIYATVRELLQSTGHARDKARDCSCMRKATVQSIHRIENWRLWQGYQMRVRPCGKSM